MLNLWEKNPKIIIILLYTKANSHFDSKIIIMCKRQTVKHFGFIYINTVLVYSIIYHIIKFMNLSIA